MRIYIASDHAGFHLKRQLIQYLKIKGLEVEDLGPFEFDPDDDYPDFIIPCAQKVSLQIVQGKDVRGIVIGGSGQGEAIAANKVKGITPQFIVRFFQAVHTHPDRIGWNIKRECAVGCYRHA